MDRRSLLWQMTAEQFAAFDVQLYLDTHPNDIVALEMFQNYLSNFTEYKNQFESMFGPIYSDSAVNNDMWMWIENPWPWEVEAN